MWKKIHLQVLCTFLVSEKCFVSNQDALKEMQLNKEQSVEIMKKIEEPTIPTYPQGANHADPDMQIARYNFMNTSYFHFGIIRGKSIKNNNV